MNETERVAALLARFSDPTNAAAAKGIRVGIGDDAAVIDPSAIAGAAADADAGSSGSLVWTIDAQVEGTHFRIDWVGWKDIGWRSFMAAASDLAAMGASPGFALSSLALTDAVDDAALDALAEGQAEASKTVGAPIVGGNLARSAAETSITTTLLGSTNRPITRAGARAGDGIYLGGVVGLAAAGLTALLGNMKVVDARIEECIAAWRRPRALIDLGLAMRNGAATSAIDISDGLARDAFHVAVASSVTLVLEQSALLTTAPPALLGACEVLQRDPLDVMLHGGEDYALLVTSPSPIDGFVRIGSVEAPSAETTKQPAVILARVDGTRVAVDPAGFDHFSGSAKIDNVRITMTGH